MARLEIVPSIYAVVIIGIVLFILAFYILYFRKDKESFSDTALFLRILVYSAVIILFLLIFVFRVIVLYITAGKETGSESWIFTICNALLLGIYINVIGFQSNISNNAIRYIIIFTLVFIALSGLGYLGILIEFRKPVSDILFYNEYQSNSAKGIYFFSFNVLFFILIYFISFITESERKT